jgi:hypothetical protein
MQRHGGLPRAADRQASGALAWRPGPTEEAARDAWERSAPCALTVRSLCTARGQAGAVTRSMVARWGLACSKVLSASTGGVPGWRWVGGVEAGLTLAVAHLAGAERGVGAGAVVGVGGEGAPMSGGAVDGRQRREVQVRCQNGEGESWRGGEKTQPAAAGSLFLNRAGGEAVEGGSGESGDTWRQSGGERGGPERRRRHFRVTVEGGGVGPMRGGVANRWAGTRWGPVVSGWVWGRGSVVRH